MSKVDSMTQPPSKSVKTIVHIGAGYGRDIDAWLDAGVARVILAEPDPRLASDLRRRYASEPRVSIHEAAIAGKNGPATLRLYNFAGANSLRKSERLADRFPNLRKIEERNIEALGINDFIRSLALKSGDENTLVVSAPGEEGALITALTSIKLARTFTDIVVQAYGEPLYNGHKSPDEIAALLKNAGFDVDISTDDGVDPRICAHRGAELEKMTVEIDEIKEAAQKSAAALQEHEYRQKMAAKEFGRLEGQLALIKDVLIRERSD